MRIKYCTRKIRAEKYLQFDSLEDLNKDVYIVGWLRQIFPSSQSHVTGFLKELDTKIVNEKGKIVKRFRNLMGLEKYKQLANENNYTVRMCTNSIQDRLTTLTNISTNIQFFNFVEKMDWEAGDFGDHGSCFFSGGSSSSRKLLERNDVRVIRTYDEKGNGIGRTLILPGTKLAEHKQLNKPKAILFNTYGHSMNFITRLLSNYWDADLFKIRAYGDVYINSESVYAVYPRGRLETPPNEYYNSKDRSCYMIKLVQRTKK